MGVKDLTSPGKARIRREAGGLLVTVDVGRNIFVIGFLIFWLCGWAMGEFAVISVLFFSKKAPPWPVIIFMGFWLTGWTFGGYMALRTVLMMIMGRQEILISSKKVEIAEKIGDFGKPKEYPVDRIKNFRVTKRFASDTDTLGQMVLTFDYDGNPVDMAAGLDQTELESILNQIKMCGYLSSGLFADENSEPLEEPETGIGESFDEKTAAGETDDGIYRVDEM